MESKYLAMEHAFRMANIPFSTQEINPQIVISRRYDEGKEEGKKLTWVVFFSSASNWAFELPSTVSQEQIFKYVDALMKWDVAMAEHERPSNAIMLAVREAQNLMLPCDLKDVLAG